MDILTLQAAIFIVSAPGLKGTSTIQVITNVIKYQPWASSG